MAACVCIVFASSAAWAELCQEEVPASDTVMSSSLAAPTGPRATLGAEIKTTPARRAQACTKINPDECKWSLPEGQPQPAPDISIRKTVAAYAPDAFAAAPRSARGCAPEAQGPGPYAAFLARIFRPPRSSS